jgi:hypothetical protein
MGRRLDRVRVKPEDLEVELVMQPTIAIPPDVDQAETGLPAWLSRFPSLLERRGKRRLLAELEQPLSDAYASFSSQLRDWLTAALARLASLLPGRLWAGFLAAALLQLAGAGILARLRRTLP